MSTMDKNYIYVFRLLNTMHFKISSLFRDLINDMNHYKKTSENLKKELDKHASEVANLKKENKTLEQNNVNLELTLYNCLILLSKIDFSKTSLEKDYYALLEDQWIKNHKNKNENKFEIYKSYSSSKSKNKDDLVKNQNITNENIDLRHVLSDENEANEIISTNFKSPCKNFRISEDLLQNKGGRKLNYNFLNSDIPKTNNCKPAFENLDRDIFHSSEKKMTSILMEGNENDEDDEDDVILESPKLPESIVTKKKKTKTFDKPKILVTTNNSVEHQNEDLDETYINTAVIYYHQLEDKKTFKETKGSNKKQWCREKSPEYDSVPFYYKRSSLRKKSDRMKLPGHTCFDCNQYYKNVFGYDTTDKNFREILNKCSRHRDKNSQNMDDTPPDYWKPYLTASVISPKTEDTVKKKRKKSA